MSVELSDGSTGTDRAVRPAGADGAEPGATELDAADVVLVYDKECPACDNYVRVMRVRDSVGTFRIVDAREDSAIMREITAAGLDVDEGMVLKMGGRLYYGSDAIHALALISSRSNLLNRLNYLLFRSRRVSGVLYPILRACRGVLLKLLGRTRINNLGVKGRDRF